MVSSFNPHSMCAKVERMTAKTGCTSFTNWTISFKVRGVSDENTCVSKAFHFYKLISTEDFFLHPTCKIQSHILKFQPFLTTFAIFHAFNDLFEINDSVIGKHYNRTQIRLKLGMVSSFDPH